MDEDELYDEAVRLHQENQPYLEKIYRRETLTPDEQAKHDEILKRAASILDFQRKHSERRRSEREQHSNGGNGEPFWFRKVGG